MTKNFYRTPTGGGDTLPIVDTTAIVKGSADATKLVRIEADGLTTGTTRVITMSDADVDLTPGTDFAKPTESLSLAVSDETTALTTGTAKITFRMPYAFTLTDVRASVTTAPTNAILIVDINEGGSTIMTTNKLSIDATEKTSTTAATAPGITDTALADDAEMTIDIDQVGSTVAGAGLKVTLIGFQTL